MNFLGLFISVSFLQFISYRIVLHTHTVHCTYIWYKHRRVQFLYQSAVNSISITFFCIFKFCIYSFFLVKIAFVTFCLLCFSQIFVLFFHLPVLCLFSNFFIYTFFYFSSNFNFFLFTYLSCKNRLASSLCKCTRKNKIKN